VVGWGEKTHREWIKMSHANTDALYAVVEKMALHRTPFGILSKESGRNWQTHDWMLTPLWLRLYKVHHNGKSPPTMNEAYSLMFGRLHKQSKRKIFASAEREGLIQIDRNSVRMNEVLLRPTSLLIERIEQTATRILSEWAHQSSASA
jgi:hypothetical protein